MMVGKLHIKEVREDEVACHVFSDHNKFSQNDWRPCYRWTCRDFSTVLTEPILSFPFLLQKIAQGVVRRMVAFYFYSDCEKSSPITLSAMLISSMQSFSFWIYLTNICSSLSLAANNAVLAAPNTYVCTTGMHACISADINGMLSLCRAEM